MQTPNLISGVVCSLHLTAKTREITIGLATISEPFSVDGKLKLNGKKANIVDIVEAFQHNTLLVILEKQMQILINIARQHLAQLDNNV